MEKIAMHQVREILRLRWSLGRSVRQTAASVGLSRGVVSKTTTRASLTGLNWELVCVLSDGALDERVYGKPAALTGDRAEPDPIRMHLELKRPGVTLELLHIEYKEAHPDGYQYTAFCQRYRRWLKRTAPSMRQKHVAGEKTFVDYSGVRPHYIDEATGERVYVELFVAVLGGSSLTYVEATHTQTLVDWIGSNQRMYRFVGGVSRAQVPDQLRSAVSDPDWFDPTINRTYQALATHYGTSVFPARPGKPKDKAKAEVAVLIAQRISQRIMVAQAAARPVAPARPQPGVARVAPVAPNTLILRIERRTEPVAAATPAAAPAPAASPEAAPTAPAAPAP